MRRLALRGATIANDLTGGKLGNPALDGNKETLLPTLDQRNKNGTSHTGNSTRLSDTSLITIISPILDVPHKDDLIYLFGDANYAPTPKHATDGWGNPMDWSDSKAQVLNNSI